MTEHDQLISESVDGLYQALSRWKAALHVDQGVMFDAVTGQPVESVAPIEAQLASAIGDFDIPPSATSGNVNRYPGLFSVDQATLEATVALNNAKAQLEQAVANARASEITRQRLRGIYAAAGAPRMHPKQAWRQITILAPDDLESVGFTIAKLMSSIEIMNADEAMDLLAHHEAYNIISFIRSSGVEKVRLQTPLSPHVRANIVWGRGESRRSQMIYASLPFLVPAGTWPAKRVRFNQPRNHARRSDTRFHNESMPLPFIDGGSISLVRDAL